MTDRATLRQVVGRRDIREKRQFAWLRHYRTEPKHMDELLRRVGGRWAAEDALATVIVFAGKGAAVLSSQTATRWVKENAADLFSGTVDAGQRTSAERRIRGRE
jgi:predicted ATP-grasp superfamily ATP-dependent carboligase